MKSSAKNIITSIAVLAVGAAAGAGLFFGVQALLQLSNPPLPNKPIEIKRDYNQERNFNLIEYQYNGQYFLGQSGLDLLNRELNERLPFGPEIDQLKYISFNHPYSLPDPKVAQINGQYNPFTMELDIDTRRFIDKNQFATLEQKVEFVFTIILHEYGHHLANSYMTAIEADDPQAYNKNQSDPQKQLWVPLNGDNIFLEKNLPNSFFRQWEDALNYDKDNFKQSEMQQQQPNILYKKIPSKQLYDVANHGWSEDFKKFTTTNPNEYPEIEKVYPVGLGKDQKEFTNANLRNLTSYAYGIDELLTRHFVTFNYLPKTFPIWSTAIDAYTFDAVLRNQMNIENFGNSSASYAWDNNIFAVDNIFGGILKQANNAKDVVVDSSAQKILKAYKDVVGEGKLVSQIFFNNSSVKSDGQSPSTWTPQRQNENDLRKIKIGGYLPKDNPDKIKGLVVQFENSEKEVVRFEHVFTKTKNLHTKEQPDAKTYTENEDNFDPYITNEIDLNGKSAIVDIQAWTDQDDNEDFDQATEMQSIQRTDIVTERPITTFRESFQRKQRLYDTKNGTILQEGTAISGFLPINILNDELIYKLKWSNGKVLLEKKKMGSTS